METPLNFPPSALLLLSLLVFLFSTRQFAVLPRVLIWLVGAALLLSAILMVANDPTRSGLLRAIGDAVQNQSESVLAQALARNGPGVARYVLPMLDVFLIMGAALAILALIAFTPGEGVEKVTRPLAIGLVGAMLGCAFALVVVGIGFGEVTRPRAYAATLDARDIHDGDTFWVGEVSVRLLGVDAPELNQECGVAPPRGMCGAEARRNLASLLDGAVVLCVPKLSRSGVPRDSFGRPLVTCGLTTKRGARVDDLGFFLISHGRAVEYEAPEGSGYGRAQAAARAAGAGLWDSCTLTPRAWRRDRVQRGQFITGDLTGRDLIGSRCPPTANP